MQKRDEWKLKKAFGLAEISDQEVKIKTDSGTDSSKLNGQLILEINLTEKNHFLSIKKFNLTATSVKTEKGDTGLLSFSLVNNSDRIEYQKRKIDMKFTMNLHYPLITKIHGYKRQKEEELDNFMPYVDTVAGHIEGEFERPLEELLELLRKMKEPPTVKLDLRGKLDALEYYVDQLSFQLVVVVVIAVAFRNRLKIQPVFVRKDATDQFPTGKSFDTLMQSAKCMWRKCCIDLLVLDPIYVDDESYKHINNSTEAQNFMNEVDVDDAVEVCVASTMSDYIYNNWGGGASFDSGTANAKIVSCDAQLSVPDPGDGSLGAINFNHLAHELGHSLSLRHPGAAATPPMVAATPGTVMEPSGFYADNPHPQSQFNCDNADNPILKWYLELWTHRCIQNPEIT